MNWYQHAHNPEAITGIFRHPPKLEPVRLFSMNCYPSDREATLYVELLDVPDKPSPRWLGKGFDVFHLQLDFFGVRSIEISGWEDADLAAIGIVQSAKLDSSFRAQGIESKCRVHFKFVSLRIAKINGYKSSHEP